MKLQKKQTNDPQTLCALKTLAQESGKHDQVVLNNMVFVGQQIFSVPSQYDDFKGLGKFGVSSPKLGWDFSFLEEDWEDINIEENESVVRYRKLAKLFGSLPTNDIALLACWIFDPDFLQDSEKSQAETLLQKIKKNFLSE